MSFLKKIGSKKRPGSCPPTGQGGSQQITNGSEDFKSVKFSKNIHVNENLELVGCTSANDIGKGPVISRTFTNSNLSVRTVNALMARGNKYKILQNIKQKHTTGPKVNLLLEGHHNDGGQFQTKVFRNNAGYSESINNGSQCQKVGHWSVKTWVEADQCPQSRETVVLQKQSKNATQNVS